MKATEFEAKLATVSDAKLRQMLAASRSQGPAVAVAMILSEQRKRGLEEEPVVRATSYYPKEGAGAFGSDAPAEAVPGDGMARSGTGEAAVGAAAIGEEGAATLSDSAAPALAPEWLSEETKSGMPVVLKAILLIAFAGGVLALAWKFAR